MFELTLRSLAAIGLGALAVLIFKEVGLIALVVSCLMGATALIAVPAFWRMAPVVVPHVEKL